jgi:hypothetical protein
MKYPDDDPKQLPSELGDHAIELAGASPADSPGLLDQMTKRLLDELPDLAVSGGKYVRGKADQQTALAAEIRVRAIKMISEMEVERLRQVREWRMKEAELKLLEQKDREHHKEKMFELQTDRLRALKDVVDAIQRANEAGIDFEMETVVRGLLSSGGFESGH